jgi:hypothetical protein
LHTDLGPAARSGAVESRQLFDHLDGGANGVLGMLEAGHERVVDWLDDGPGSFPEILFKISKC